MNHFWNSLQHRLYGSFSVVIAVFVLLVVITAHYQNLSFDRNDQTREGGQLSTNAFTLITLAHRYIDAPTKEIRLDLKNEIVDTIAHSDQILADLRDGNLERDTPALNLPELMDLRDQIAREFDASKPTIDLLFASEPSDYEAVVIVVDNATSNIPQYARELTEAVDEVADQERTDGQRIITSIAAVFSVFLVGATLTVMQTVRAIDGLAKTADAFALGNLTARAKASTLNELSTVANTFNQMASQISDLIQDLEKQVLVAEDARARAEKADQVKSTFLATVSHELRTPLNAIINFSKFVVKGVMGPVTQQQTEALTKVVESGKHLLNLINDVLDISKIEAGSLNLFIEPHVNIRDLLQQTSELSEALLEGKPVTFQMAIADNLPEITADKQRLRQIITNVLSNACKFTEEGRICLKANYEGGHIQISVEDTGPGIAAEDYNLVFESFKQTETGLRQGKGTGLGMPISRKLAEALGGKLWFESTVGKGSTFFIDLPVSSEVVIAAVA